MLIDIFFFFQDTESFPKRSQTSPNPSLTYINLFLGFWEDFLFLPSVVKDDGLQF